MICSAVRVAAGVFLPVCLLVMGQSPTKLEFEAASIRRANPGGVGLGGTGIHGGPSAADPGRISYDNLDLSDLVVNAYKLHRFQLVMPQRLNDTRFHIVAKLPPGATRENTRLMLQSLLTERWGLKTHREKREMPVYVLSVGKEGVLMKLSTGDDTASQNTGAPRIGEQGCPEIPGSRMPTSLFLALGNYCITGTGETIAGLADMLSGQFDRPVLDRTGLTAKYDFFLRFNPVGLKSSAVLPVGIAVPPSEPKESDGPDIATAMRKVGLRFESAKAMVEVLIVDHANDLPTEN